MSRYKKATTYLKYISLILMAWFFSSIQADNSKTLTIAITSESAPYIVDFDQGTGIDPEILSAVLNEMGYQVKYHPTPSRRQKMIAAHDAIDGVTGWVDNFIPECHKAIPYRYWYNALIVPRGSTIKSLADLGAKKLAVFVGAEKIIPDYLGITKDVASLLISDHSIQAGRMIKSSRVDAYIGDFVGYYYTLANSYSEQEADQLSEPVHFFELNKQMVCFKDETIRDEFNQTLTRLRQEGLMKRIYAKYSPKLPEDIFTMIIE